MTLIGNRNRLRVLREVPAGVYLDGEDLVDILLPRRYVPAGCKPGDEVEVFVYIDSEDRLIATTQQSRVEVGQCACLKVVDVNNAGAFLDWGLPKDLLAPFAEQQQRMEVGKSYVVYVHYDEETEHLVASSKLHKYLPEHGLPLKAQQPVQLLVAAKTPLGYKAVIEGRYLGMIFNGDALQPLRIGQRLPGFVKAVRADGRVDLCLQLQTQAARDDLADRILRYLQENAGRSTLTDRSTPEAIYRVFHVSKGSYKKAIGNLYRQQKIEIADDHIALR